MNLLPHSFYSYQPTHNIEELVEELPKAVRDQFTYEKIAEAWSVTEYGQIAVKGKNAQEARKKAREEEQLFASVTNHFLEEDDD